MNSDPNRDPNVIDDPDRPLGQEVGEAAGGISGVLLGAGIGSAAGPIGTVIGGVAGALGGWWAGRAVVDAAGDVSRDDDDYYRAHYDSLESRPADRAYDDVRAAYYLGQIASHNPNFTAREFDEVAPELERGWTDFADRYGAWTTIRAYAQTGFTRGRSRLDDHAHRARSEASANDDAR